HIRIIRKKSSDGFSPWFLLLGCLSTCWSFFNILILQWRGLRCCKDIIIIGNFVVSAVITTLLMLLVNDGNSDHHSAWTMLWAGFLSVGSVLLAMIQFLPQIVETYFRKSVGALSIPMLLMQTPYAIIIAVGLALNPESDWSTWFPYAFTAILQAVLLGMCLFFYIKAKRLGLSSFHPTETTPLLQEVENEVNGLSELMEGAEPMQPQRRL
ncbi:hypothetical protein BGZ46_003461, partial [Entomortierella lignicola]